MPIREPHQNVSTPWGKSQGGRVYAPGITFYHTASHGGVKLSNKVNDTIPAAFRIEDGWYEEDCDQAIPFYFLFEIIRDYCMAHGLEGYTVSAEEYFQKFDAAYFRSSLERWHTAECVVHFGEAFSDEHLKKYGILRADLEKQVAVIKRRISTPEPIPGQHIEFDYAIHFTDGSSYAEFVYQGGNEFQTLSGRAVRITGWRKYPYSIPSTQAA